MLNRLTQIVAKFYEQRLTGTLVLSFQCGTPYKITTNVDEVLSCQEKDEEEDS